MVVLGNRLQLAIGKLDPLCATVGEMQLLGSRGAQIRREADGMTARRRNGYRTGFEVL